MKRLLRVLGWFVLISILLVIVSLAYSTASGHLTWFFRVDGVLTVDGIKTSGYLHANTKRTFVFLTRTDGSRPETYLVSILVQENVRIDSVSDCGNWYPPRFLPFPMGRDDNPPCFLPDPSTVMDGPVRSTLINSRRSIEFSTKSGKKVKAEW